MRKGRLAANDSLVTLAMAILGPDWGNWDVVEHDIRMAREFGSCRRRIRGGGKTAS